MSQKNGNSSDTSDLEDLGKRLDAAQSKRADDVNPEANNSLLGMAWRISTELVIAVLLGCAIGFGIDHFAGTRPWITILGLMFGTAAGLRNCFRLVMKMEAEQKERLEAQGKAPQ